jgi:hypothetical protein
MVQRNRRAPQHLITVRMASLCKVQR